MEQVIRIGMDTSKHIFQLHGVDAAEKPVLRKRLGRKAMVDFFGQLPPTVIGIEACGASHQWARVLAPLGHQVKLIAPQHVKPYVKRNKNDGRDAEALCEAMSRPTMRFVPVKTAEQQAALMLAGLREQMIARRTQISNTIRGHAAEFGITVAQGLNQIEPLLARLAQDESVPELARDLFALQGRDYAQLQVELRAIEVRLKAWHRANDDSRRLAKIPGVGPIGATALVMKVPDPGAFASGRHFAAWLGLTPKDHSTAGKTRLGKITRAGDERLRSVLVAGATAVIQQAKHDRGHPSPWLLALLKRKPPKLAAVALANKIARIAWKLMATGESYDGARMPKGLPKGMPKASVAAAV
jgi:transposase